MKSVRRITPIFAVSTDVIPLKLFNPQLPNTMNETKHTPGPWHCTKAATRGWIVFIGPKHAANDVLYIGSAGGNLETVTQDEANAALIARAPALLAENAQLREALRDCDKAFACWQVGQIPGRPEDILGLIVKARAALSVERGQK